MRFRFGFFQRTISFLFCLLLLQCLSFQNSITNSDFKYLDHLLTAGYAQAADITDAVVLIKGRLRYDRRAKTSYVDISLQNVSSETFLSPIRVIIDSITDPMLPWQTLTAQHSQVNRISSIILAQVNWRLEKLLIQRSGYSATLFAKGLILSSAV